MRELGYNVRMKSSAIWMAAAVFASCAAGAVEVGGSSLTVSLDEQAKGAVTRLVTAHGAELAPAVGSTPLFRLKLISSLVKRKDKEVDCKAQENNR